MTIRTKRFLVAIMLFLGTLYGRAQSQADRSMLAEHVFSWMLQNEIDSLCDCMEESVRTMDEETILDAITAVGLARTYFNKVFLPGHSLRAMTAPHYFVPQHQVNMARTLATPMLSLQGERDYQVTMSPISSTINHSQTSKDLCISQ